MTQNPYVILVNASTGKLAVRLDPGLLRRTIFVTFASLQKVTFLLQVKKIFYNFENVQPRYVFLSTLHVESRD